MRTYNIGEALCEFKIDSMAYIFKGKAKGALMWVDLNNDNRIVVAYNDGVIQHGIHVSIQDVSAEEGECIVFVNEVRESISNDMSEDEAKFIAGVYNDMNKAISRVANQFKEELEKLEPEEQVEVIAELRKQHAKIKKEMTASEEN